MSTSTTIYCNNCGAPLDVEMNREFIFCQYCGSKNIIHTEGMKTNINIGDIDVKAKTDFESMISSVFYAIEIKDYKKAEDLTLAAIMSGCNKYLIYIAKAMIDLQKDDNAALFADMAKLRAFEQQDSNNRELSDAISKLMHYRGCNGVTVLHNATFHELMEWVTYCVEHGSDVNLHAGMNNVTPISIMFVPVSKSSSRLDGTPFIRNKAKVKEIRRYLMDHGASDRFRLGY